jgi:hypothetical protein
MKPVKAWAVLDDRGRLATWDYRLPLTWQRRWAVGDNSEHENGTGRIVRVEIREVQARKALMPHGSRPRRKRG